MDTINWTSLGTPGNITTNPAIGKNDDGRLEAFVCAMEVDPALWHIWQTTTGETWSSWNSLSLPPTNVLLEGSPTVVENDDGRLEVFATGADNALWHIWQLAPNGSWSTWTSLGKPTDQGLGQISVHVNDDGRLEVFTIGADNALWHIWQLAPNGSWSTWKSLDKPPSTDYITNPIVSQNQDGRLEAFVLSDNALWHIWQTTPGGSWGSWFSTKYPTTTGGNLLSFSSPLLRKNDDGRLELFVTIYALSNAGAGSFSATLWHIWQVSPNGTWSNWTSLGSPTIDRLSAPSVRKNDDGRLEAFAIGSDNALWHIWQLTTGGAWGSWSSLGTPSSSISVFGDPFVAENDDGRLEAFAVGSDGALWHTWQVSPGGHWG
ncbi:MAG TPA: hypothetical protein VE843_02885 [Ktedonobacteraceae bacterium]|nr:hypothetical protein [Ktedonobacteraceae bacterium]